MKPIFTLCLTALCLGLVLPSMLAAQDTWRNAGAPEGGAIASLVRSARGTLYAGRNDGTIFRSSDDGSTWRATGWRAGTGTAGGGIVRLQAAADGALYGFVYGSWLYRSTDEGANWQPLAEGYSLFPAFAVDSGGALLAVDIRGTIRSTDGGASWTHVDDLYTDHVTGLAAGPDGVDYMLPTAIYDPGRGNLRRSTDGGKTWAAIDTAASPLRYMSLAVTRRGTVLLGTLHDGVLRSTDHGDTWWYVTDSLSNEASITDITILSGGEIVAIADGALLRSTDDGVTWRRTPVSTDERPIWPTSVAGTSGRDLLVGSAVAGVVRVDASGADVSFANQGLGPLAIDLLTVDLQGRLFGVSQGRLYRSIDGGRSWSDLFRDVSAWMYAPVVTREGALLISLRGENKEGILRSTDGGTTWDTVTSDLIIHRVVATSDGRLYASTYQQGIYRSTDDGRTWTRFGADTTPAIVSTITTDASGDLLAGTVNGGIYRISRETGAWTAMPSIGVGRIDELFEQRDVLFAQTTYGILRSVDGGATWSVLTSLSTSAPNQLLRITPDGTLWGVTGQGVFRSTDIGVSWTPVNDGLTTRAIAAMAIGPDGRPYLGTDQGVFALAEPSSVRSGDRERSLRMLEIGPNPAGSRATLELAIDRATPARAALFDVEGRRLRPLFDGYLESGHHRLELDLSGIADGVYLVRLETDGGSATRSIVVAGGAR